MRWIQACMVAGLAAAMVGPAMAQRPDGQRGGRGGFPGGGFGGGQTTVFSALRAEAVQKELAITEDQKTKLSELGDKVSTARREAYSGFGGGGGERPSREEMEKRTAEIREKTDKINADNKPALAAILSADQMTRLEQIVLQVKGAEALNEKDLQAKLMVTEEQKGKLASITKEFGDKISATIQRPEGGQFDREAFRAGMEKREAIAKERDAALVAVLTPAQAEQLDMLKGKALSDADLAAVRRGPGGGRGPGPGGPGGGRGGDRPQRPATEN
jgi:transcription termination factor NusB